MRIRAIITLLYTFISIAGFSQQKITGLIKDEASGKPLPFATIVSVQNGTRGVTSNLNGEFSILITPRDQNLRISYMGYITKEVEVSSLLKDSFNSIISLTPSTYSISEVTVYPKENPAHRIINNAIANISKNNPDLNGAYSCRIYNKTLIGFDPQPGTKMSERYKKMADSANLLITESVVDKSYKYKDIVSEKVIANRVSGFQNPLFALTTSFFQPFHFYDTYIPLLDKRLLNPISINSTKNYFFLIKDTIVSQQDTTFIIEFTPRRGTNFEGMKGFIHINSNGWAIENVVAQRAVNSNVNIRIEQEYKRQKGRWFPSQYRYRFELKNYPPGLGNTHYEGVSTVYDATFSSKKDATISKSIMTIADSANKAYHTIEHYRSEFLSLKDSATYNKMDSIGATGKLDRIQSAIEYLGKGFLPIGPINLDIKALWSTNKYEKYRLGLGLETNRMVSSYFKVGGYIAYGTKDKGWKHGAGFTAYTSKEQITNLSYSYRNDLVMPTSLFMVGIKRNLLVDKFLLDKADKVIGHQVGIGSRTWELDYSLYGKYDRFAPTYSYRYLGVEQQNHWSSNSELGLSVRWGAKEKETRFFNLSLFESQDYPVIGAKYRKGVNALGGNYSYSSYEIGIYKTFRFRKAGFLRATAIGGYLDGNVPYSLLYGSNGTNSSYFPLFVYNSFSTAKPFEYASNQYANIFLYYNLGSLLYNSKHFKPTVSLFQAAGWSKLNKPQSYQGLAIKDMSKGFYESGLILGNIVRMPMLNIFYLGFGAGGFVSYGGAVSKPLKDTFTLKMTLEFDF